jgi:hypothetical protein
MLPRMSRPGRLLAALTALAPLCAQSELSRRPVDASVVDEFHAARQTELRQAVERGLEWLAARQQPNGGWLGAVGHKQGDDYLVLTTIEAQRAGASAHAGISALAGLAFLAAGHLPDRGRHGPVVRRALDYVLACTRETGMVTDSGTRMYSHAFATLFLAQALGTVRDERVKSKLERAVHLIVDCQNAQGAWRYNAFAQDADLSVTVCQLQGLRAARNVGIRVPRETIDLAVGYVQRSRIPRGYDRNLFTYKIRGRGAYEKNREYAVNAAALTSLFSAGIHEPELYDPVLEFLADEYPRLAMVYPDHYFFWYGNFYACQAFFQAGGERFRRYFARISEDLLRWQAADGHWANSVGPGDEFATAVACLILSIPQQYLPIFQR